jgi:hypothetical protein
VSAIDGQPLVEAIDDLIGVNWNCLYQHRRSGKLWIENSFRHIEGLTEAVAPLLGQLKSGTLEVLALNPEDNFQTVSVPAPFWRISFWEIRREPAAIGEAKTGKFVSTTWLYREPRLSLSGDPSFPSAVAKNLGGRPPKFDWLAFDTEITRLANTPDGLPSLTELRKYMLDWISKWPEPPSETSIKNRTAKIYRALGL